MGRGFFPDSYAPQVHEIDFGALYAAGFRGVILDIDNTLESHKTAEPSDKTLQLLERVRESGFALSFLSNNHAARAERFAEGLGVHVIADAAKPSKKGYVRAMALMSVAPEETVCIGDQIFTDIWGGNRAGAHTILVRPIEPVENGFFVLKRALEKPLLWRIRRKLGV